MCGIVGHISNNGVVKLKEVETACQLLAHRGPDGRNSVLIDNHMAFGHTRLSFLDLSEKGKQPMFNNAKNLCITFNGEIYNYLEIKKELESTYDFVSGSDTEVILAAYQEWGLAMIDKLEGMFAMAIYDGVKQEVHLIRDRFGIKPLYYYYTTNELIFSSELKAIHQFAAFQKALDITSFCDFFTYRYIPSPKTIWQNTFKVKPAHYITLHLVDFTLKETEYWLLKAAHQKGNNNLVEAVNEKLRSSIEHHARADVPVGAFLSGGYDSSAICAYLKELNYTPSSFSIGFENWSNSEDKYAAIVAKHLGVPNKSIVVDDQSLNLIDIMPQVYDEPIADISIIPTYLVSKLASQERKAVMSGEGADELFVGYHWQKTYYEKIRPKGFFDKIKALVNPIDTVSFYAEAMAMGLFDKKELEKMLTPAYHQFIPADSFWFYRMHDKEELAGLKRIQYLDMKCFMGELVLTKVDRASMANSLELRVPFLNKDLVELIFARDEEEYYRREVKKFLLFENIKDKLPIDILAREKQGFVGPDQYYMNKAWYKKQLKNSRLVADGIIKQSYIDALLSEDYDWRIWKILVMEKWYQTWMS